MKQIMYNIHQIKEGLSMRYKKVILTIMFLLSIGLASLKAQEAIPATGGNASGNGGIVSYTVGQLVYTTNTGTSGFVSQGVQQPLEVAVVTGLEEAKDITLQCLAYPNPTTDFVMLKIENYKTDNLSYQLYSINGVLLENKKIEGNEMSIGMRNLAQATYFLKVTNGKKEVKTFKIIKK